MRHHHHRTPLQLLPHDPQHLPRRLRIHTRRRLVQNHHRALAQHGAREGDELALTEGEVRRGDGRVEGPGLRGGDAGEDGGAVGGGVFAEGVEVRVDGAREEVRVLREEGLGGEVGLDRVYWVCCVCAKGWVGERKGGKGNVRCNCGGFGC